MSLLDELRKQKQREAERAAAAAANSAPKLGVPMVGASRLANVMSAPPKPATPQPRTVYLFHPESDSYFTMTSQEWQQKGPHAAAAGVEEMDADAWTAAKAKHDAATAMLNRSEQAPAAPTISAPKMVTPHVTPKLTPPKLSLPKTPVAAAAPSVETAQQDEYLAGIADRAPEPPSSQSRLAALINRVKSPDVTPAVLQTLSHGDLYSAAEFLADMQELGDGPDDPDDKDAHEVYAQSMAALLSKAADRLNHIMTEELAGLATPHTDAPSFKELGQIVRITFIKVKAAPTAWALLTYDEHSAVVRALMAMAAKRNTAALARPTRESKAAADSEEVLATLGVGADIISGFMEGLDL